MAGKSVLIKNMDQMEILRTFYHYSFLSQAAQPWSVFNFPSLISNIIQFFLHSQLISPEETFRLFKEDLECVTNQN